MRLRVGTKQEIVSVLGSGCFRHLGVAKCAKTQATTARFLDSTRNLKSLLSVAWADNSVYRVDSSEHPLQLRHEKTRTLRIPYRPLLYLTGRPDIRVESSATVPIVRIPCARTFRPVSRNWSVSQYSLTCRAASPKPTCGPE
jgi:hypothetical protein